jgi:hypothetical protein
LGGVDGLHGVMVVIGQKEGKREAAMNRFILLASAIDK